jgi:predicted DNA-binding antitoxin AbrB/MazE fold protein
MSHIEAIYRRGVFEPLEPVNLREEQRVALSFAVTNGHTAEGWLNQVKAIQTTIVQRQGVLPDSASEIAADRAR